MNKNCSCGKTIRYERNWAGGSRLWSIVAMSHPMAVIIFASLVSVMAVLARHGLPNPGVLLLLVLAMVFAQAAIGIFNEVSDYKIDRVSKPWRAIPAGLISVRNAQLMALGFCLLALVCSAALSMPSLLLLALGMGIGILYSARLKGSAFSWLAYAIAYPLPPIWVWVSLGKLDPLILFVYPIAIPFAVGVHLCNQLRDYDEDLQSGVRGTVQRLGKQSAMQLCYGLLVFSPVPAIVLSFAFHVGVPFLLVIGIFHWCLIVPLLQVSNQVPPKLFRTIFRRLQLTGPMMLLGWLAAVSF